MEAFKETRLKFTNLYEPFPVWEKWPCEDDQLDSVEIGPFVSWLPFGDPRTKDPDPFVTMMQEAYRCIAPGGYLALKVPNAMHGGGIGFPLQQRVFNRTSFACFGRPVELDDQATKAADWAWDAFGADFGCRFDLVLAAENGWVIECHYEKPVPAEVEDAP